MLFDACRFKLDEQYSQLDLLCTDLSREFLEKRHISGKWSIGEHAAHLGRYHEIFLGRLREILTGRKPYFERYVAENDAGFSTWQQMQFRELYFEMMARRSQLKHKLEDLAEGEWNKTGIHPKFGEMKLYEWMDFASNS